MTNKERWQKFEASKKENIKSAWRNYKNKAENKETIPAENKTPSSLVSVNAETGEKYSVKLNKEDFEDKKTSPFTKKNPYNYHVNVNHPAVTPHYRKYQKFVGADVLSNKERFTFEQHILEEYKRLNIKKADYPEKPKQKWGGYGR